MNYQNPSPTGFYGEYGGSFIPEMLYPNIAELTAKYLEIIEEPSFKLELAGLLKNYVGRETPLTFAPTISKIVGAKVYLKREDLAHTGAHKINNTLGQILLAQRLGKKRIIAETGAGQHGVATATVCALMKFPCVIFMGAVDIERQALNVTRMKMLGAEVRPVTSGSATLKDATNEAMRDWINNPNDTHYIIGSVVGPHPYPDMVARFQAVISKEIASQCQEFEGRMPNEIIACVGGGSNAMGSFYHFLQDENVRLIGIEAAGAGVSTPNTAATIALGKKGVLHGSMTRLLQTIDGQIMEAHSISAGLDYPGVGPHHVFLADNNRVQYHSVTDEDALTGALFLARSEGIIPALETAHAFSYLMQQRYNADQIVIGIVSGRGDKDMQTYHSAFKY